MEEDGGTVEFRVHPAVETILQTVSVSFTHEASYFFFI